MLSAIIVNLSWVLPIIYIWSLPLLRQTDLLTTTDEDQNSISHYIGDATGTGMLASVSFPAFFPPLDLCVARSALAHFDLRCDCVARVRGISVHTQ